VNDDVFPDGDLERFVARVYGDEPADWVSRIFSETAPFNRRFADMLRRSLTRECEREIARRAASGEPRLFTHRP
jgi:hypothetical protein